VAKTGRIPAFVITLARRFHENGATDRAAQLSYYFLFSLFPLLAFLVALAAYLPVKGVIPTVMARLEPIMPDQALNIIRNQLTRLATNQKPHVLTLTIAAALWSASRGVDALRSALNLAYGVKESRPWWRTQAMAVLVTLIASLLMIFSVAGLALGGRAGMWLASLLHLNEEWPVIWSWLRWPVTACGALLVMAVLYWALPDVKHRFRLVTAGSVVGGTLWLVASWAFTEYAEHFGSYDKTYGSIGGVIVLMTWFYLTGLVVILGGELDAMLEESRRPPANRVG
jgi:membrane protein